MEAEKKKLQFVYKDADSVEQKLKELEMNIDEYIIQRKFQKWQKDLITTLNQARIPPNNNQIAVAMAAVHQIRRGTRHRQRS